MWTSNFRDEKNKACFVKICVVLVWIMLTITTSVFQRLVIKTSLIQKLTITNSLFQKSTNHRCRLNITISRLPLIPYPKFVKFLEQQPFCISKSTPVIIGKGIPESDIAIRYLLKHLADMKGRCVGHCDRLGKIILKLDPAVDGSHEGYHLMVSSDKIKLLAPSLAGLFYAVQTLQQLTNQEYAALVAVMIKDAPRFQWRGLQLDVSRHFFGAAEVKQLLNTMASFKFNVFHWHLTDDQGWRLPVEGYPLLTQVGAESVTNRRESYTPTDIEDVVKYARERHIEILPEVDVPGHTQAAIAAYPHLGNTDIPGWQWKRPMHPAKNFVMHKFTMNPSNSSFLALDAIFSQVSKLFPLPIVHIGGDEVNTEQWDNSRIALSIKEATKVKHVQSIFIRRLIDMLRKKGKSITAWDEAQHLDRLPPDVIIMAWRSANEALDAVNSGNRVVIAHAEYLYFDYYQGPSKTEPKAIGGFLPLQKVYDYDPMPRNLSKAKQALVLGAQGQLWSEYFWTWRHVEYMAFPRALALAERVWTPNDMVSSFNEFRTRLKARLPDLDAMGVNYRKIL